MVITYRFADCLVTFANPAIAMKRGRLLRAFHC